MTTGSISTGLLIALAGLTTHITTSYASLIAIHAVFELCFCVGNGVVASRYPVNIISCLKRRFMTGCVQDSNLHTRHRYIREHAVLPDYAIRSAICLRPAAGAVGALEVLHVRVDHGLARYRPSYHGPLYKTSVMASCYRNINCWSGIRQWRAQSLLSADSVNWLF